MIAMTSLKLCYADRVNELDASDPTAGDDAHVPVHSPPLSRSPNMSQN